MVTEDTVQMESPMVTTTLEVSAEGPKVSPLYFPLDNTMTKEKEENILRMFIVRVCNQFVCNDDVCVQSVSLLLPIALLLCFVM